MSHLNKEYSKETFPEDYFVSIFLAVLDLNTYGLSYTGAGFQESLLINTKDGRQISYRSKGLPISRAIPEELVEFSDTTVKLYPGTSIMINTDGLIEQMSEDEDFYKFKKSVFYENSHVSAQD